MGDAIGVLAGSYPGQTLSDRRVPGTSPGVTFSAVGGTVSINGELQIGEDSVWDGTGQHRADWITLIGPFTFGNVVLAHATNITIDRFTIDKKWQTGKAVLWIGETDKTTLRNAEICCNRNEPLMEAIMLGPPSAGYGPNSNITIEDAEIHGMRRDSVDVHSECFLAPATPGLTLNRTHWHGCNVMNINIGAYADMDAYDQRDYQWTNNIFESPTNRNESDKTGYPFIQGCNPPDWSKKPGWILAYNIFETGWYPCPGDDGLTLRGNLGEFPECPKGAVSYEFNIWSDRSCGGSTDRLVTSLFSSANFTNIAAHDWAYTAGAVQIDKGDPANYPAIDIALHARPVGAGPDAGPYEYTTVVQQSSLPRWLSDNR
jgi:hypothetical protein